MLLAAHQVTPDTRPVSPRLIAVERELVTAAAAVEQLARRCQILRSRRTVSRALAGGGHAAGKANLVVTGIQPGDEIDGRTGATWVSLLRPGGVLAVLTHSDHRNDRLIDPTGRIVAAAQGAGLRYLQHIVALHVPIRNGTLAPCRTRRYRNGHGTSRRHIRVHADVLVFAHPKRAPATGQEDR